MMLKFERKKDGGGLDAFTQTRKNSKTRFPLKINLFRLCFEEKLHNEQRNEEN